MELVMVLPIFMFLLLGMFEFAFLFIAQGQVETAAQSGARLATLHGVQEIDVVAEVQRTLTPRLQQSAKVTALLGEFSGDEIVVTVEVPSPNASPDFLWPIGYSLQGKTVLAQTRMIKE